MLNRLPIQALEDRCLLSFSPLTTLPVGTDPQAVVTGDFNNDGKLDLATANAGSQTVSVLLGNGLGGFGSAIQSAAGANPRSLAVGDFDKDGKLDLAAANGGGTGISVLLGKGDGTFQAPTSVQIGSSALSVAVGDFNADGKMDLAVSSQSEYTVGYYGYYGGWYTWTGHRGHINVLLGTGGGSFAAPNTYDLNSASPLGVAVADLNADGGLDVITANEDRGSVSVLLGNGNGTLGIAREFAASWSTHAVTVGDFTGDGKLDLATAGQTVDVLPGIGDGSFQPLRPTYVDPVAIAAADFNGDAKLDVVTADPSSAAIGVLLGRGTGIFTLPIEFAGSRPLAVAVGDFNGDGRADVVAANAGSDSVMVLLNDGVWPALDSPSLRIGDVTVTEGDTGTVNATFTVTLSVASTRDVTVRYVTAAPDPNWGGWNPAAAGSDYQATSGSVTIRAGQTSSTFTVAVYGDRLAETTELFVVRLSDPVNAFIADGLALASIEDDEPYATIESATAVEGNAGTTAMIFTVILSSASGAPVSLDYTTVDGSARAGTDYEAKTGTVVFAAGQTSATFTVLVYGDLEPELDEYFLVRLSPTPNAHVYSEWGYGTIIDDEPRITVESSGAYVAEGNAGTTVVTFTVRLSSAASTSVTVNFSTAEGDTQWWSGWNGYYYYAPKPAATAGIDFQSRNGFVTFAVGETSKTITVVVNGDRIAEADEVFSLDLSDVVGAALLSNGHAVSTIVDDEPRISVTSASLREGNSGITYLTFTVSLSAAYGQPVTVRYATQDGSALAGSDYQATSGMLTFAAGETTKTVTVAVYGDTVVEDYESFYLVLSNASDNSSVANGWGYGTIINDDAVPNTGGKGNNGKGGGKK